eukprot:scaffold142274_cov35-Attheya_sp.AAC.1
MVVIQHTAHPFPSHVVYYSRKMDDEERLAEDWVSVEWVVEWPHPMQRVQMMIRSLLRMIRLLPHCWMEDRSRICSRRRHGSSEYDENWRRDTPID